MKDQGRWNVFRNLSNPVKIQLRRKLVGAMSRTHGNGQRICSGPLNKIPCLGRIRIKQGWVLSSVISHMTQFRLNGRPAGMGCFRHPFYMLDISLVFHGGTVIHNGAESQVQGLSACLLLQAVVQMHHHRDRRPLRHGNQKICQVLNRPIGQQYLGCSDDNRGIQFLGSLHHASGQFQVDRVKQSHRVLSPPGGNQYVI